MHHGRVTLGVAWCLVLGAPGGVLDRPGGGLGVPPGTGGWLVVAGQGMFSLSHPL